MGNDQCPQLLRLHCPSRHVPWIGLHRRKFQGPASSRSMEWAKIVSPVGVDSVHADDSWHVSTAWALGAGRPLASTAIRSTSATRLSCCHGSVVDEAVGFRSCAPLSFFEAGEDRERCVPSQARRIREP